MKTRVLIKRLKTIITPHKTGLNKVLLLRHKEREMKKIFSSDWLLVLLSALILFFINGCVPSRQFKDLSARCDTSEASNKTLRAENMNLSIRNTELESRTKTLEKTQDAMAADSTASGRELRRVSGENKDLKMANEKLLSQNEKLLSGSNIEARKLITQLNAAQEELQRKEDALKASEKALGLKQTELEEREKKVAELQTILSRKDSITTALKNSVAEALLGFRDQGLTVEQKNGKVYVSLEERLLFASGSTDVDPKGQEALRQLAKVLEKKQDISIMVEGHTDDVPMKGSGDIRDNWDLSVMRATSVVKILLGSNLVSPKRISAAGRGEYFPLDAAKTPEARKKNRRTEIILTPKLDEILKILEGN